MKPLKILVCNYHVYSEIRAEQKVEDPSKNDEDDEEGVGDPQSNDVLEDEVDVDSDDEDGQTDGEQLGDDPAGELPHDVLAAGEGDGGDDGEGQHERHQAVEEIVHAAQVRHVLEEGDHEGGEDGDGSGEENSLPLLPLKVEEALWEENIFEHLSKCDWTRTSTGTI